MELTTVYVTTSVYQNGAVLTVQQINPCFTVTGPHKSLMHCFVVCVNEQRPPTATAAD